MFFATREMIRDRATNHTRNAAKTIYSTTRVEVEQSYSGKVLGKTYGCEGCCSNPQTHNDGNNSS